MKTLKQAVYTLGELITQDKTLCEYAAADYANLKELVGEFLPNVKFAGENWTDARILCKNILTDIIFSDKLNEKPWAKNSMIGYGHLILSHIQFRENELSC